MSLLKLFYKYSMNIDWAPNWVNEKIKDINDVQKSFPIDDFEINLDGDFEIVSEIILFLNMFKENISNIRENYINILNIDNIKSYDKIYSDVYKRIEYLNSFLQVITNLNIEELPSEVLVKFIENNKISTSFEFDSVSESQLNFIKNKLNFVFVSGSRDGLSSDMKLTSFYRIVYNSYHKVLEKLSKNNVSLNDLKLYNVQSLDQIQKSSNYDFSGKTIVGNETQSFDNLSVVFSTKVEDILKMSSSSEIFTSCQDIFSGELKECAVPSALDKHIGIIYLTNNEEYKDRGRIYLYRCLVRMLKKDNEIYLYLDKMYPSENKKVRDLFNKEIKSRYSNVLNHKDDVSDFELIQDSHLDKTPYHDNEILNEKSQKADALYKDNIAPPVIDLESYDYENMTESQAIKIINYFNNFIANREFTKYAELYKKYFPKLISKIDNLDILKKMQQPGYFFENLRLNRVEELESNLKQSFRYYTQFIKNASKRDFLFIFAQFVKRNYYGDPSKKDYTNKDIEDWINNSGIKNLNFKNLTARIDNNIIKFFSFNESKAIYIFKQEDKQKVQEINKDKDIVSEGFLKGTNKIPNLLWQEYDKEVVNKKSYAGYEFLYNALVKLIGPDQTFEARFLQLLKRNKSKLDRITSSISINPPKLLGSGADGVAFQVSEDKILKIFTSDYAYKKALETFQGLHINRDDAKYDPMIYDIGKLGKMYGIEVYFYLMEKLEVKLSKDDEDNVREFAKSVEKLLFEYRKTNKITNIDDDQVNEAYKYIYNNFYGDEIVKLNNTIQNLKLNNNTLESFTKDIIFKILAGKRDLHGGNVGVRNIEGKRQLVFFDPAFDRNINKIAIQFLREMKKIQNSNAGAIVKDLANQFLDLHINIIKTMIQDNEILEDIKSNGISFMGQKLSDTYDVMYTNSMQFVKLRTLSQITDGIKLKGDVRSPNSSSS